MLHLVSSFKLRRIKMHPPFPRGAPALPGRAGPRPAAPSRAALPLRGWRQQITRCWLRPCLAAPRPAKPRPALIPLRGWCSVLRHERVVPAKPRRAQPDPALPHLAAPMPSQATPRPAPLTGMVPTEYALLAPRLLLLAFVGQHGTGAEAAPKGGLASEQIRVLPPLVL